MGHGTHWVTAMFTHRQYLLCCSSLSPLCVVVVVVAVVVVVLVSNEDYKFHFVLEENISTKRNTGQHDMSTTLTFFRKRSTQETSFVSGLVNTTAGGALTAYS